MNRPVFSLTVLFGAALCGFARAEAPIEDVTVDPATVRLSGPGASYMLLVHGKTADGRLVDVTRTAKYRSSEVKVAAVDERGSIRGMSDGTAQITVEAAGKTRTVAVQVEGSTQARRFNFENDIEPLLSRFGCNSSGCHGKAEGQNGFKLSVFGFDPPADYAALTKEGRGRRVFPAAPEHSLLLTKMSGGVAHGGGLRIARGSAEYETFRAWIAAGLPVGEASDPTVASVRVEPRERLLAMKGQQQLRVIARYSDGREADVTGHARFQSNNDGLAVVDAAGLVTAGESPGDVAVMASYMNQVDVFRALVPRAERIESYPAQAENNFIDGLVFRKLRKLNVLPSEAANDAEFLRRVYLDIIGTLPTPVEARRFLEDKRADRRARLVDELLARPEYADYWALKWADLLRVDRQALGHKTAYAYYRWIRESLAANKPYDRFARELLTAEGPLETGPAGFYKAVPRPGDKASTWAQVFLGVRIACAECHHHPFDRWSQDDYYGMRAFFTPLTVGKSGPGEMLSAGTGGPNKHPRTGKDIFAHALGAPMPATETLGDRRAILADWMTAADNPYFARNLANRVWAHFLGRGLVEPVDDVRATNPPTNPELLDALARHLVENKYDVKQLIRTITASRVYQLASKPNVTNERDEQNYSRAFFKRIDAEVLLDMVSQTTGIAEKFPGVPAGSRAIQLWDSKVPHYFLKLFGRPIRSSACECERNQEPGVSQVLHVLNSPEIHAKLSHEGGTIARLVKKHADDGPLVEELYLTFFSRLPDEKERKIATEYLARDKTKRREAAEDLAWSMMNALEFVFNH
jgi:murein DD-endopeptidase MepM/ murein hydrolase activator NlpD